MHGFTVFCITTDRAAMAGAIGAASSSQLNSPPDGVHSLTVLMVGLLPRLQSRDVKDVGCGEALTALGDRVLPALRRLVLAPHLSSGRVEVYGHTWGCGRSYFSPQAPSSDVLAAVLRKGLPAQAVLQKVVSTAVPVPSSIGIARRLATAVFYFFLSINRGLSLLDGLESRFTLLMRWDVVFYTHFLAFELNANLLYRANWCRAIGPLLSEDRGVHVGCRGVRPLPFMAGLNCSDRGGVPDFWLAGSLPTLRVALLNASEVLVAPHFRAQSCPSVHGPLAAILQGASDVHGIQLGRYLFHQLDYDFVRSAPGRRFDDALRGTVSGTSRGLWAWQDSTTLPRPDEANRREPLLPSSCPINLYYCGCTTSVAVEAAGTNRSASKPPLPVGCTRSS